MHPGSTDWMRYASRHIEAGKPTRFGTSIDFDKCWKKKVNGL
jgi:hypothetical protein